MAIKQRLEKLENMIKQPQEQELHLVIIRACGRPGPSQEEIEAAKAEARGQGNQFCIVMRKNNA